MIRDYAKEIAKAGLEIGAIKLFAKFPWASGIEAQIYNDNRMFLFYPEFRRLIAEGFIQMLNDSQIPFNVIAGTSTSGISPATTLADLLVKPLIYVRDKPKNHGLQNQIEGIDAESDLEGRKVILIEDVISTGGSSARAVQVIRNANGYCDQCLSIFSYELNQANQKFNVLEPKCNVKYLLNYKTLIQTAKEEKYVNDQQLRDLNEFMRKFDNQSS